MAIEVNYILSNNTPLGFPVLNNYLLLPMPGQQVVSVDAIIGTGISTTEYNFILDLPAQAEQTLRVSCNNGVLEQGYIYDDLVNTYSVTIPPDVAANVRTYDFLFDNAVTRVDGNLATYGITPAANVRNIDPEGVIKVNGTYYMIFSEGIDSNNQSISGQKLYTLNVNTGEATPVSGQPNDFGINLRDPEWIAYDPTTDTAYVSGDDSNTLNTVNLSTGQATVGPPLQQFESLVITPNGSAYGVSRTNNNIELYSVNLTTGDSTFLFPVNETVTQSGIVSDLFYFDNDILYAVGDVGSNRNLYIIDLVNQNSVIVPDLELPSGILTGFFDNPATNDQEIYLFSNAGMFTVGKSETSVLVYKTKAALDSQIAVNFQTPLSDITVTAIDNHQEAFETINFAAEFSFTTYQTDNPPLNLFENTSVMLTNRVTQLLSAPRYVVPANPPSPSRMVYTNVIITRLTITNLATARSGRVDILRYNPETNRLTPVKVGLTIPGNSTFDVEGLQVTSDLVGPGLNFNRVFLNTEESLVAVMQEASGLIVDIDYLINTAEAWVLQSNDSVGTLNNPSELNLTQQPITGPVNTIAPATRLAEGPLIQTRNLYIYDADDILSRIDLGALVAESVADLRRNFNGFLNFNDTVYGVDNTELYRINVFTGQQNLVAAISISDNIEGLETHNNAAYAVTNTDLYTLNLGTGEATLVGSLGIDGALSLASFNGVLYCGTQVGDFYSVNATTGSATLLGNLGITNLAGMTTFGNLIYICSNSNSGIYSLNPTTLELTALANLGLRNPQTLVVA